MSRDRIVELGTYIIVPLVAWVVLPLAGKLIDTLYFAYPNVLAESVPVIALGAFLIVVGMGLGVTLIPALAGMQSHDIGTRVALRPLASPGASRIIGLVWRRRSPVAPTMENLAKFLKDKLPPATLAVK